MILELDMGNTRCKWRLRSGHTCVLSGAIPTSANFDSLESQLGEFKTRISNVWAASVAGRPKEESFSAWCQDYLGIAPVYARAANDFGGVINGYKEPLSLGVDRWVGIVACRHRIEGAFMLVSLGTAITIDLVAGNGRHAGGFIAPGVALMLDSLRVNTQQVDVVPLEAPMHLAPGKSTDEAVHGAVAAMVTGLIDNGMKQLQQLTQESVKIIFTGGDAPYAQTLYPHAQYEPSLVLDGLSCIFGMTK